MSTATLVTGGAGFLGSHLCERLISEGGDVICLDNFFTGTQTNIRHLIGHPRFEVVRHDVCEPIIIECDQVYHLACPASPVHYQRNPARTIRTAVEGTLNMLNLARDVSARILIASTSEVYGDPKVHPQHEDYWGNVNPIGPRACYDEGKRCAESLTVSYSSQYNVDARIVRIFNTYGPRMHKDDGRVVSNFIVAALEGRPLTIFGDGSQTRSFCFVDDELEGLVRLMHLDHDPGPVNVGNPHEISMLELADLVLKATDSRSKLQYRPLPTDDPLRRKPDITKAKTLLGWEPTIPVEAGLRRTAEYFREHLAFASRHAAAVASANGTQESLPWRDAPAVP